MRGSLYLGKVARALCALLCLGASVAQGGLSREADPVILTGSILEGLQGARLEQVGCFRAQGAGLVPIPCQIDEKTAKGAWVLPYGPQANAREGDGVVGRRDELVFMARDAGEFAPRPAWPAGLRTGLEVVIADALDGAKGYVYLGVFEGKAPRSSLDYVQYSAAKKQVESERYRLGFSAAAPIIFDYLALKPASGGSGENGMDRMKIRLNAKVWGTIPIVKTENDYGSELVAWLDGPVRVLRRTRNWQKLFWNVPSPSAMQDNFFYQTYFEFPVVVALPLDLDTFLSQCDLRISLDFRQDHAMAFYNSRNPTPVVIDGQTSPEEARLDVRPARFGVLYGVKPGQSGGWVTRLSVKSNVKIEPWLYYRDDVRLSDAPESVKGQLGNLGYQVKNLTGLTKGTHILSAVMYSFPVWKPGIEKAYLAVQDAPLKAQPGRVFGP